MWMNGDLLHVGSEDVTKCFATSIGFPLNEWLPLFIKLARIADAYAIIQFVGFDVFIK
jgi:hypothetical protein